MSRILLWLAQRENRRLLAEALQQRHEVLLAEDRASLEQPFDLGVFDGPALDDAWEAVHARKHLEQPAYLPILLLTSRQDIGLVTRHLWRCVDDIIFSPVERIELQARVESLLVARKLSVSLEEQVEERTAALRREIAERKRIEAERWALEAQLRQQQKLEALGTLASGVAHEINNPINGIINYAQLILDAHAGTGPDAERARAIVEEARRIAEIVRHLLQFARQGPRLHSTAYPREIILRTLALIQAVLRRDQISLQVELPDDLPTLRCHTQQIQQVLMNLLTNARDALNERFPGYHPDKILRVTAQVIDDDGARRLRITVEDHGAGVPEELRERVFEPFFTTKPKERGTGLGLAISHGIVKDHGGRLWFESSPGQPTRFHLDLPLDPNATLTPALEQSR